MDITQDDDFESHKSSIIHEGYVEYLEYEKYIKGCISLYNLKKEGFITKEEYENYKEKLQDHEWCLDDEFKNVID